MTDAGDFAGVRRWILRPDRMREDPFGNRTVREREEPFETRGEVVGAVVDRHLDGHQRKYELRAFVSHGIFTAER